MIKIRELFTYPMKSTKGNSITTTDVLRTGLRYDRTVAIIDAGNRIVTGRQHPKLLLLSTELTDTVLTINATAYMMTFGLPTKVPPLELKLFRNRIFGLPFDTKANDWISDYLDGDFRLVYLGNNERPIPEKRGGHQDDRTGFTDSSPVHLINLNSMRDLNSRLKYEVSVRNFRPNMVIDGAGAWEEDRWNRLRINGIDFRVQEPTQRCIFTTIDPLTTEVDASMQPLASIAKMRLKQGKRPTFGINLVPMETGTIIKDNILTILEL